MWLCCKLSPLFTLHFVLIRALRILCGVWEGVYIVSEGFDRVLKGFMRVAGFRV